MNCHFRKKSFSDLQVKCGEHPACQTGPLPRGGKKCRVRASISPAPPGPEVRWSQPTSAVSGIIGQREDGRAHNSMGCTLRVAEPWLIIGHCGSHEEIIRISQGRFRACWCVRGVSVMIPTEIRSRYLIPSPGAWLVSGISLKLARGWEVNEPPLRQVMG